MLENAAPITGALRPSKSWHSRLLVRKLALPSPHPKVGTLVYSSKSWHSCLLVQNKRLQFKKKSNDKSFVHCYSAQSVRDFYQSDAHRVLNERFFFSIIQSSNDRRTRKTKNSTLHISSCSVRTRTENEF